MPCKPSGMSSGDDLQPIARSSQDKVVPEDTTESRRRGPHLIRVNNAAANSKMLMLTWDNGVVSGSTVRRTRRVSQLSVEGVEWWVTSRRR